VVVVLEWLELGREEAVHNSVFSLARMFWVR
jgi:hypothetical protein